MRDVRKRAPGVRISSKFPPHSDPVAALAALRHQHDLDAHHGQPRMSSSHQPDHALQGQAP
jgi:hypothetical protein